MSGLVSLAAETSTSGGEAAQFWILGPVALLGGLGTVLMRRAVYSALCLAGTMVILALFYLANGAYFLGMVQIVVYTGAVMMLFLFVLMLVGVSSTDSLRETLKGQRWLAAGCGLGLGLLLVSGIGQATTGSFTGLADANSGGNVQGLASLLFTRYVVAFEVTGVLLTIAAVGATLLTHRERLERAKTQREQAEARVREGKHVPPLPAPGVYARHNAVDLPGLLPDGTPSELTVNATLRARGQVREVHQEAVAAVRALEQRTNRHHGRPETPAAQGGAVPAARNDAAADDAASADAADGAARDAEEARK
ncbi:NADH-quinone oxidoreductase subunit J [Streptomyces sp. DSM 44915]|uniref:NADH-quinone oxidoreductase subunit J n=1 Tax=Streptomyces chisholmiae TaxID=3075540 RepID=A0ABU2JSA7_9ACTN|nr:NADH-quinone oxidoreductase subunit J [Streptomyces sp. DSM 44915]MDT0267598.1 NADH-quinone oxidoreductase subunit J [Streptomyces sp. DSM 44915]